MADSKPVVRLAPHRWRALCGALRPGSAGFYDTLEVTEPIEADGVTFLPAVYRAA